MQDPNIETLFIIVHGKVQGVGYRHATVRRAHMLGVTGWVQNMENGTVQAMVQGSPDQVDHMLEWMRRGPPAASVTELESRREDGGRRFKHFAQH
ncbi:acylphosphatase [Bordetella avium]|uniref:Acylphosphatase n=1 Tax=Bordetella avium (strain 197N) TaxID=360910 RepID=ACYP_BORA1|nr:acylphosphatase [Bordetella avium]Q2KTJ9.1 RecName: Full=Acylphosphatase; AltName: Full=Acylphosphate phosphohydrolase [Bordetella avium 197N]AZY50718.1 acylphosphatase [Bordetella avium]AZY54116.1 acylphosphatase [Bordetella avium]RIQ15113.1 acylphosphatase [Bordetella avium]RIQ20090.1 acylphosphatase [Bordetella avium]RIQ34670.1 acylphosphatase [Bordetella avium]